MKTVFNLLTAVITIVAAMAWVGQASADDINRYYAGVVRSVVANGVTALISTPQSPLNPYSGVSSWVSTYASDANGKDWLQTGWRYYVGFSIPKQYVEYCVNCRDDQG